jgi:hypothetical protein
MSQDLTVQPGSAADVLAVLQENNQSKYGDDKALAQVTKAGSFLPYLQVMGSNSPEVQNGDMKMGVFALCKNKVKTDIGSSLVAMIFGWRPKAMSFKPSPLSYYNPNSDIFKKIEIESQVSNSGKAFGPEFFLWLPEHKEFATFFFGSATGRVEGPNLVAAFKKGQYPCRLACELIEYKKLGKKYHGARYYPYDIAITVMPDTATLKDELYKFNNPAESEAEPAEKAEDAGSDRG